MTDSKKQIQAENEVHEQGHGLTHHFCKRFFKTIRKNVRILAGQFQNIFLSKKLHETRAGSIWEAKYSESKFSDRARQYSTTPAHKGLPHKDAFFMRRVAFRQDASTRNLDNMEFCEILGILQ